MASIADLAQVLADDDRREALAARVQVAADLELPPLAYWNYLPCRRHRRWTDDRGVEQQNVPKPGCPDCGLIHRKHQRIGATWLFLKKRALLADTVGSGKTVHAGTLIAMMKESGELDRNGRVLFVCRASAVPQHRAELQRMLPGVAIDMASGTKRKRMERYSGPWEVMVIGQQMFLQDYELFFQIDLAALIVDDVDALRNRSNRTAYALKKIAARADRCVIMTGTPLQKKLHELHSVLEPIGGRELFGSEASFMRRYVRTEQITTYNKRNGRKITTPKILGYQNIDEFKRLIAPMALRRTAADLDDVTLPAVVTGNVYLDLYPKQRAKYAELQKGVVEIIRNGAAQIKHADSLAKLHYGAQICGGLASLGEDDGPETSVKLDWLMDKLVGDLEDEKVVVFMGYKATIKAFHARLAEAGIAFETIWGEQSDKAARKASQDRFWRDPACRVLVGTQAIEQSLNLQCARHLVNFDMILNPARMEQLAGRIRRDGSAYPHVFVHNLLTRDTQEERYLPLLEKEQALIDKVWDENSELFESVSPLVLMHLITG